MSSSSWPQLSLEVVVSALKPSSVAAANAVSLHMYSNSDDELLAPGDLLAGATSQPDMMMMMSCVVIRCFCLLLEVASSKLKRRDRENAFRHLRVVVMWELPLFRRWEK